MGEFGGVDHIRLSNGRAFYGRRQFMMLCCVCFTGAMASFAGDPELRDMRIEPFLFWFKPRLSADDMTLDAIAIPSARVHAQASSRQEENLSLIHI